MQITFYGGAGGVTGSKHLVEVGGRRILLDCGTFQGLSDVRERNRSLPFPPESIDQVVLSHAHIDHCGMLPLLVKNGFRGSIFATQATCDMAMLMMEDMAGIEKQDARYRVKHKIGPPDFREPLFTQDDVLAVKERFVPVPYARDSGKWFDVLQTASGDGVQVRLKFYDAGHILGSAISVLEFQQGEVVQRLAYSGDVGSPGTPLLYDPQVPKEEIQTVLLESTYGGKEHKGLEQAIDRLGKAINAVVKRKGKIIIPAFSLGRTQLLVYVLHKLTDEGVIPRVPVYVDSPLATDLTHVFLEHEHDYDTETWVDFQGEDHTPLMFSNLEYTRSKRASQALNNKEGPFIVVSASGMMTAGRVVHHLRHSIRDARNALFITGYQAAGTLGRRLLEGAKSVDLYGDRFPVKAEILVFNEFSAHADRAQLTELVEQFQGVERVMLVHGEPEQADEFRDELAAKHPDWQVARPDEGDTVELP